MNKRAIIRMGDITSHGGIVSEAFPTLNVYGKNAAGIGHGGYCPQCKRDFVIVEGAENFTFLGKQVAVEGMLTSCGAVLIASQNEAILTDASEERRAIGVSQATTGSATEANKFRFGHRFLVVDAETGEPLINRRYTAVHVNGQVNVGKTDGAAYTTIIESDSEGEVSIQVEFAAPSKNFDRSALA